MIMSICVSHTHNSVLPASQSLTWQWHHPGSAQPHHTPAHTCPPDVNWGADDLEMHESPSTAPSTRGVGTWLPTRAQADSLAGIMSACKGGRVGGAKQVIGIDLGPFERCTVHLGTFGTFDFDLLDFSWLSAPGGMTTVCQAVAWENPQPNPYQPALPINRPLLPLSTLTQPFNTH